VTGASDADPSAIVTCTQVGASTGYGLLWLFPFTTAGLICLESLAARIGIRRGRGIATLLSERFGAPAAWAICSVFIGVNVVTLAADVAGAASILNELTGLPQPLAVIMAAGVPAAVVSFGTFSQVRRVLLFLTPLYLLYALAAVAAHPAGLLQPSAFVPRGNIRDLLFAGVGLAGAILTPYVFFWQVEDTAQRERRYGEAETEGGSGGMIFANLVLLFVVLMAAATLHSTTGSGLQLATLRQASDALRPLLGRGAFVSFSAAILASELIAAPVIAAVCGYVVANLTQRRAGLSWSPQLAKTFYLATFVALLLAACFALLNVNPVGPLFWAQVANGCLLPLLIVFLVIEARGT